MSYSTLYRFDKEGKASNSTEYRNGWGYAMPVWNWLADRYLSMEARDTWFIRDQGKPVFNLQNDPRLKRWERICLLASFDRVVVKREHFPALIEAFRKADAELRRQHPDRVCHYGTMANEIEKFGEDVTAAAFQATSVSEDQWQVHDECKCPKCGTPHTTDETRPYNLTTDKNHWFLFEHESVVEKGD